MSGGILEEDSHPALNPERALAFASCVQAAVLDADVVFVPAALYAAAGVHTPSTFRVTIPDVRALPISVPRAVPVRVPVDASTTVNPFCTDPSE